MNMTPLRINEVIAELQAIKDRYGNLECHFDANGEDDIKFNIKPVLNVTVTAAGDWLQSDCATCGIPKANCPH